MTENLINFSKEVTTFFYIESAQKQDSFQKQMT